MKRLILIRHGETEWNTEHKFQGKTDIPLSDIGISQANGLAERLFGVQIDKLYCSPLKRAAMTASAVANAKSLDVTLREELSEVDFGRWEGLTLDEIKERFPEEHLRCRNDPFTHGFRDGLSFNGVRETVEGFINSCLSHDGADNIAIVSHSVILKMTLLVLLDLPPGFIHSFRLDNCSVSMIEADDDFCKNVLVTLNNRGTL